MQRRAILVIALSLVCSTVCAGEPIIIGERIAVQSKIMGEERTILVSTPPGYDQGAAGMACST